MAHAPPRAFGLPQIASPLPRGALRETRQKGGLHHENAHPNANGDEPVTSAAVDRLPVGILHGDFEAADLAR